MDESRLVKLLGFRSERHDDRYWVSLRHTRNAMRCKLRGARFHSDTRGLSWAVTLLASAAAIVVAVSDH